MLGAPHSVADARAQGGRRNARAKRRIPIALLWTLAGLLLVLLIGLVAFVPVVRSKVAKEAARRHLEVTVGSVRPGFFAVRLNDVRVKPEGVPGVDVHIEQVKVDLSAGLSLREVSAHGGEIKLEGEPEELAQRLKDFQKKTPHAAESSETKGKRVPMSADGLSLAWKMPSEGEITGSAIKLAREDAAIRLACGHCTAKHRHFTLDVTGGDVELGEGGVPRRIAATSVTIAHEPPKAARPAESPKVAPVEPAPPPLPPVVARKGGKGPPPKVAKAAAPEVTDEPVLPLPDLHALRAKIAALATTAGNRVPDGTKVDIGGLAVKLDVGGEPFAFGPGPFTLERKGDRIFLAFTSDKGDKTDPAGKDKTPLSLEAELPLAAGDVTARLSGGPVSLAMLGVKDGTKGLLDVAKGTVSGKGQLVLAAAGDALTFDGQIALRSISIKQPRLSHETLRGLDFAAAGRGLLDDQGKLRIDEAHVDMGALHVSARGTIEDTKDHFGVALNAEVAPAACQALLDSTPQGLLPTVRAARMSGTFGATARVVFDTRTIDKLVLDYTIDDKCRMTEVPRELSPSRFAGQFTYRTYHPDGTPSETVTGPGSTSWTELDDISPFMVAAVLTTEDGAFYKHHGFNHNAIRNATAANLKARRFARGASTITMQLAKNLFLSREKTLSRKIEELILTDYLEQAFRKDDMMELYLNVIEFGPDVYGITRAADYYFGRKPEELNLPECFFLASIMPSPIRYGRAREKGQVSEGWMKHVTALMEIAGRNHKVSPSELAEGLSQTIVFYKPGDPRPEPRKPVSSTRRDPLEDDQPWQPLD